MEPRLVTGCQDFVFDCPPLPSIYLFLFNCLLLMFPSFFFPLWRIQRVLCAYGPLLTCKWKRLAEV